MSRDNSMLEILQHTPVWVYIAFLAWLYLSIRACFTREINIRQASVFPVVFIFLSLLNFYAYPHPILTVPVWIVAAVVGGFISRTLLSLDRFKLGKKAHTLVVPGSYAILVLLLVYFVLRYYLGYQGAIHGGVQGLTYLQLTLFFCSSGFISGFFIARTWLLRKYFAALSRTSVWFNALINMLQVSVQKTVRSHSTGLSLSLVVKWYSVENTTLQGCCTRCKRLNYPLLCSI